MANSLAPCGTQSAYQRHVRNREPIDEPCRIAHTRSHRSLGGALGTTSAAPTGLSGDNLRAALAITDRAAGPDDARELLIAVGLLPDISATADA